jgi:hypothetical protein
MMSGAQFNENGMPNIMQNGGNMLKLNEFQHNQYPSGAKMMAENIRCGISD